MPMTDNILISSKKSTRSITLIDADLQQFIRMRNLADAVYYPNSQQFYVTEVCVSLSANRSFLSVQTFFCIHMLAEKNKY